jgi:trigger factor
MDLNIEKKEKAKIEISFEIPWEEFSPYLDRALSELSQDKEIKGFRKGNIPKEILEKEIGRDKVVQLAAELAIKEKYSQAIKEKEIEPIANPDIQIIKLAEGNPFKFKASVPVLEEIKLPDYKKIAAGVEKKEVAINDQELEETLQWLRKSKASFSNLERAAQTGDFISIEYESSVFGEGKPYKDKFVLGEGHFIPGFEKNLEGLKKGEVKNFSVDFPKDYVNKKLAGKKANFKVKVESLQKMELPELNDNFAQTFPKINSLLELKNQLRDELKKNKEIKEQQRVRDEILEKIVQAAHCEAPTALVESEKEYLLTDLKEKVKNNFKLSFEEYLKQAKKSEEELRDSFLDQAQKRVKAFLILREIGKREGIQVSEEEVSQETQRILDNYPDQEDKSKIDIERLRDYNRSAIYNRKIFKKLESFSNN